MDTQDIKIRFSSFFNKYLLLTLWWSTLVATLIALAVVTAINSDLFNLLLQWDFFNNKWNFNSHTIDPSVTQAFLIYLYMAILAAILGSIGLITVQAKIIIKRYIEAKYKINSSLDNNYFIFKNLLFVNIAKNITYIFCFTNALTFILVLFYWFFYFIGETLIEARFKFKQVKSIHELKDKWWTSERKSLIIILIIESLYFILSNFNLNINGTTIDFATILKYFIPASSLALIIAVFIQTLVKNDVKQLLNNISTATKKADDFKIFYQLEGKNVLTNYEFICNLPSVVRIKLKNKKESKENVLALLNKIYQLSVTLEAKRNSNIIKKNDFNYLIYHIFYEVKTDTEIEKLVTNFKSI